VELRVGGSRGVSGYRFPSLGGHLFPGDHDTSDERGPGDEPPSVGMAGLDQLDGACHPRHPRSFLVGPLQP
jgi:hypothetical protein